MSQWSHVEKFIARTGPFMDPQYAEKETRDAVREFLRSDLATLVVGAGGLGCELLKNLALSGFGNLHVVDMDTIDVSNLNRQFLFRERDVGRAKAEVAAAAVAARVRGCQTTAHVTRIQELDDAFYAQFQLVVCGLDSIEARRWLNATLQRIFRTRQLAIPLIDGGVEGLSGQARVIVPGLTPCFECLLAWFPPAERQVYPVCTLANTPRLPEHCIEWAMLLLWPQKHEMPIDGDDPEHIGFLFDAARERAEQHGIAGVTLELTQGVVKNIVTAIASSNAIIAAACCSEAFKLATLSNPLLDNYWQYTGTRGIATTTISAARDDACPVCAPDAAGARLELSLPSPLLLLRDVIDDHLDGPATPLGLEQPSVALVATAGGAPVPLYVRGALLAATRANLDRTLLELGVADGAVLAVTDPAVPFAVYATVRYKKA